MPRTLELEAPTPDEAVDRALAVFDAGRDAVDVEILDPGHKGVLGMGARLARVRITLRGTDGASETRAADDAGDTTPPATPEMHSVNDTNTDTDTEATTPDAPETEPEAPAAPPAPPARVPRARRRLDGKDGTLSRGRRPRKVKREPTPEAKAAPPQPVAVATRTEEREAARTEEPAATRTEEREASAPERDAARVEERDAPAPEREAPRRERAPRGRRPREERQDRERSRDDRPAPDRSRDDRPRDDHPREERPAPEPKKERERARGRDEGAEPAFTTPPEQVVTEMLELLGCEGDVQGEMGDYAYEVDIDTEDTSLLIGRHGQNLESLQYMVGRICNHGLTEPTPVILDIGDYRKRRAETLEDLADSLADKAVRTGRPVFMNPMPAQERRIVHLALKDDEDVETYSRGEGEERYLVIAPSRRRGRR